MNLCISNRKLCYVFLAFSAVAFLVITVQLDKCTETTQNIASLKKLLDARENEVLYLRKKIRLLGDHTLIPGLPVIYVITPTYTRLVQKAELTRLATVFNTVKNLHWIVVEDADHKSILVAKFLQSLKFNTTHLLSVTPPEIKLKEQDPNWLKPRGVLQRNTGLAWLRENFQASVHTGVVYFADDDNTYSTELFQEMRDTKKVSVWPVGLVGKLRYESPILQNGKVTDWHTYWYRGRRPFALDMAGFAVNLELVLQYPMAQFNISAKRGYQESEFLQALGVTLDDLEPKAEMCTKVLVWHTRTEPANIGNEEKMLLKNLEQSDPNIEV